MYTHALLSVFGKPFYALLASMVFVVALAFALWLPNLALITSVVAAPNLTLADKVSVPLGLLGSLATNFTFVSATYTVLIALLFGINVALLAYLWNRRVGEVKSQGVTSGVLGLVSGVLGIGCAACGSFLLASFLAFFGASGAVALLPLHGVEFGIIGVLLLLLSVSVVLKQIGNPAVCRIS